MKLQFILSEDERNRIRNVVLIFYYFPLFSFISQSEKHYFTVHMEINKTNVFYSIDLNS